MTFFCFHPLPVRRVDCTALTDAMQAVEELSPRDYAANSNEPPDTDQPRSLFLLTDEPRGVQYSTDGYKR